MTLTPGQIETKRFPVVGEWEPSADRDVPTGWSLRIGGLVSPPVNIDYRDYLDLGSEELIFDIHCVTSWTHFNSHWTGVPLKRLLGGVHIDPSAKHASFVAYSERDHHTSLPLSVALESSWLAHEFEGEPLSVAHGGPVRVVTPW